MMPPVVSLAEAGARCRANRLAVTRCEWCGEHGHDYTGHAEAVAQAEAWHPDGDDARQELSGWLTD